MIFKVKKIRDKEGLRNCVKYLLNCKDGKDVRYGLVGSSGTILPYSEIMFGSVDEYADYYVETVIQNFHEANPDKPLPKFLGVHVSFSAPEEDNDKIDSQLLQKMYKEAFERVVESDYNNHDSAYVEHIDSSYIHNHSLFSTLNLETKRIWNKKGDIYRFHEASAYIEEKYNLTRVKRPDFMLKGESNGEYYMRQKAVHLSNRQQLQITMEMITEEVEGTLDFLQKCHDYAVQVIPNINASGVCGLSFEHEGYTFKASQLGKKYSWKNLKDLIKYRPELRYMFEELVVEEEECIDEPEYDYGENRFYTDTKRFKPYSTLRMVFSAYDCGDSVDYHFNRHNTLGFTDNGSNITYVCTAPCVLKSSIQLMKEKGWKSVTTSGSTEFLRKRWLNVEMLKVTDPKLMDGIEFKIGFCPSARDKEILEKMIDKELAKKKARAEKKLRSELTPY